MLQLKHQIGPVLSGLTQHRFLLPMGKLSFRLSKRIIFVWVQECYENALNSNSILCM